MTYVGFPAASQRLHQAQARCLLQPTFAARIANSGPTTNSVPFVYLPLLCRSSRSMPISFQL